MNKVCSAQECQTPVKFKDICSKHLQINKRNKRKEMCLELKGGECLHCGSKDNLEFDHIDPSTKNFNIAEGYCREMDTLLEELKLCQLLCRKCHLKKSRTHIVMRKLESYPRGPRGTTADAENIIARMDLSAMRVLTK